MPTQFKSELDPDVLKDALPPDVHAIVDQVAANVNIAVKDLVGEFTKNLEATVKQFEQGDYPASLQSRLNQIESDLGVALSSMDKAVAEVKAAADVASRAANAGNPADMKNAVTALTAETQKLQLRLDDFRNKTANLGKTIGGATATALSKLVMG